MTPLQTAEQGASTSGDPLGPVMKSHKDSTEVLLLRLARAPTITHNKEPKTTHNDEKITPSGRWFCNI